MMSKDGDENLRDTAPFNIPFDSIEAMVDLMVLVAKSDGKIDQDEASALVSLINTLNRSVLDREVTQSIVHKSLERLKKEGLRGAIVRVGQTLAYLGKLKDALGLGLDVARSGGEMSVNEWTTLVHAGRAGNLSAEEIRDIIGDCPQ